MGAWWICESGFPPRVFVHTYIIQDHTIHQEFFPKHNYKNYNVLVRKKKLLEILLCFIFVVVFSSFNTGFSLLSVELNIRVSSTVCGPCQLNSLSKISILRDVIARTGGVRSRFGPCTSG